MNEAQFDSPNSVVLSDKGDLFMSEFKRNWIRKIKNIEQVSRVVRWDGVCPDFLSAETTEEMHRRDPQSSRNEMYRPSAPAPS